MAGLAKGLAIIEAFTAHGSMSVADAARASGTTRAAARRCLLTLAELGYLEHAGRAFRPLPRLHGLGGATSKRERLARLAQPLLVRARDELTESVSLAVLDDDQVLFIARAEAEHIVSTGVRVGVHIPAYCSATGRVLLSQFPDTDVAKRLTRKPLRRRTPRTLTKVPELLSEIGFARRNGYAISDEELELGMRSLSVPVKDAGGAIIAAFSVSAASARITNADLRRRFLPVLQNYAALFEKEITKIL